MVYPRTGAKRRRFSFSELLLFKPRRLRMHPGEQLLIARQGVRRFRRDARDSPDRHCGKQSAHYNFFAKIRDLQPSCNGFAGQHAVYSATQNR
jgi:hypothetical protein